MEKQAKITDYQKYQPSKSCYLDGRYFNKVLKFYPGLLENPLYLHIDDNGIYLQMVNTMIAPDYFGILRVVVTAKDMRHSMVVIFDHDGQVAYIYDPNSNKNPLLHQLLFDNISQYLKNYLDYQYLDVKYPDPPKTRLAQCDKSGVCNALVLLFAYKFIKGEKFTDNDIKNVRRFMNAVESNYVLGSSQPDVEYDLTSGQAIGLGVGIGAGALIGSAAGPGGILLGSAIGGALGFGIGSAVR